MARPKTGQPIKQRLNLSVSAQSRMNLAYISQHYGESISMLIERWAAKEAKSIARKTKQPIPDAEQMSFDEI